MAKHSTGQLPASRGRYIAFLIQDLQAKQYSKKLKLQVPIFTNDEWVELRTTELYTTGFV